MISPQEEFALLCEVIVKKYKKDLSYLELIEIFGEAISRQALNKQQEIRNGQEKT